jgi:hypothetical protein
VGVGVEHPGSPVTRGPRLTFLPTTRLGWWAVGLGAVFFPLVFAAGLLPRAAALGFLCGLAGGVAAAIAILRDHERAVTVFATVVSLAIGVAFMLAQLI